MEAAAARAVAIAASLRMKSNMAIPFLYPPFSFIGAAMRGAVPLETELDSGISISVDPLIIFI
jgi:hypothetical protein